MVDLRAPSTVSVIVTSQAVDDVTTISTSAWRRNGAALAEENGESASQTTKAVVLPKVAGAVVNGGAF